MLSHFSEVLVRHPLEGMAEVRLRVQSQVDYIVRPCLTETKTRTEEGEEEEEKKEEEEGNSVHQ